MIYHKPSVRVSPKVRFVHSGISTNLLLPRTTKVARSFNACGLRKKHLPQFLLSRPWVIFKSFLEKECLLGIFPARACQEWYSHLPSVCESGCLGSVVLPTEASLPSVCLAPSFSSYVIRGWQSGAGGSAVVSWAPVDGSAPSRGFPGLWISVATPQSPHN